VVVTVPLVQVVEVAGDEVVDVVAVRKRFVAAVGPVLVACGVSRARVAMRATIRVRPTYRQTMLVDMTAVHVVKVALVEIVGVPFVTDRLVSAARAVHVTAMVAVL